LEKRLGIKITKETEVKQDKDVLDTWFSSSLIPLALSGWPDTNVRISFISWISYDSAFNFNVLYSLYSKSTKYR